jgi:hypothetical protein
MVDLKLNHEVIMKRNVVGALLALCLFGQGAMAATLNVSSTPPAFLANTSLVSTQFRNGQAGLSGAAEIYVAPDGDAGNGEPRAQGQFAWSLGTIISFTFSYDADGGFGGQGLLTSTLGASSAIFGDVVGEVVAAGLSFNALQFNLQGPNAATETAFTLANLVINGTGVTPTSFVSGFNVFNDYGVTDFGTVSDFLITGTLERTGTVMGTTQSRPRLDLVMGNVTPVPVPAALPLMVLALGSLALIARRRRV